MPKEISREITVLAAQIQIAARPQHAGNLSESLSLQFAWVSRHALCYRCKHSVHCHQIDTLFREWKIPDRGSHNLDVRQPLLRKPLPHKLNVVKDRLRSDYFAEAQRKSVRVGSHGRSDIQHPTFGR